MTQQAMLPCFKCGKTLQNVSQYSDENQPYEGTVFRTEGHYGSTFWDSFDGEEIVINICDPCLREHTDRIAQHKRYLPVRCEGLSGMGRQWVDRPLVPFTGNPDDSEINVEIEELGTHPEVEWAKDIQEIKKDLHQKVYGTGE